LRKNNVFFPTAYIIIPDPEHAIKNEILSARAKFLPQIESHMAINSEARHNMANYP
jgi:hypothetical protein